jgi:hypothetical protein
MPVMTLYPYLLGNTWVFDDPATGLKEEAFVFGSSEMIHRLVRAKGIPNVAQGFSLHFSDKPFDHDVELCWIGDSAGGEQPAQTESGLVGTWYHGAVAGQQMTGWLCPALFFYFSSAPRRIYIKAEKLPSGVDPIWHVDPASPQARRFMSAEGEG